MVEGDELVGRILACGWCETPSVVCQECDHGQRYCCEECSKLGRKRSLRSAGNRYQRSFEGAKKHAARQAAYKMREREKVTHQWFPENDSPVIVESAEREESQPAVLQEEPLKPLCCTSCGRRCGFVVRRWRWPYLRRRTQRKQGEEDDCFQGNRGSNNAVVQS